MPFQVRKSLVRFSPRTIPAKSAGRSCLIAIAVPAPALTKYRMEAKISLRKFITAFLIGADE